MMSSEFLWISIFRLAWSCDFTGLSDSNEPAYELYSPCIVNDLQHQVKSDIFLFANVTKICRRISTKQHEVILQKDINEMLKWADKWQLKFQPNK